VATGIEAEAAQQPRPSALFNGKTDAKPFGKPLPAAKPAPVATQAVARTTVAGGIATGTTGMAATARQLDLDPGEDATQAQIQEMIAADRKPEPVAVAAPAPEAVKTETSFIPPRPAQPEDRPAQVAAKEEAGPVAPAPAPKRGLSLLERVAGLGRRSQPEKPAEVKKLPTPPAAEAQSPGPLFVAPGSPAGTLSREPQLGLPATGTDGRARSDDDLLDIPTFLRRQAN
jgi:cell division protein FtsZ